MQLDCGAINSTCGRMFVIMQQQAQRLDDLVRDVLSAARLEAGELVLQTEPMSVFPVIQQVIEQTRARKTDRALDEHATADHATCHIPLILRFPGKAAGQVDRGLHYQLQRRSAGSPYLRVGREMGPVGCARSFHRGRVPYRTHQLPGRLGRSGGARAAARWARAC